MWFLMASFMAAGYTFWGGSRPTASTPDEGLTLRLIKSTKKRGGGEEVFKAKEWIKEREVFRVKEQGGL